MSKNCSHKLTLLHKVLTKNYDDLKSLQEECLLAGNEIFGTEVALCTRIQEGIYSIESVVPDSFYQEKELKKGFASNISSPIVVAGEVYGTISFSSINIKMDECREEDIELVEIMSQTIGQFIEIQRYKKLSESSAKMALIGHMAGGIAHEINNPMAIISSNGEFTLNYLKEKGLLDREIEESLGSIKKTVGRVRDIVDGLKIVMGGEQTSTEPIQLRGLIDTTMSVVWDKFKQFRVEVINDVNPAIMVYANEVQLSQVILNLAQNSFDAILKNENLWVNFSTVERNGSVDLLVTDSGVGIDKDIVQKIMEPFYTTKAVGKGTGLGLSLSKSIVEGFGGELSYDQRSTNTCFRVRLADARIKGRSAG